MKTLAVSCIVLTLTVAECAPKPIVKITKPAEGTTVDQTQMVTGTSRGVPAGTRVWVVVFSQKVGRYYPQNQAADVQANGTWSSISYFGIDSDSGLKFDAIAVLVDQQGQKLFADYIKEARDKRDFAGMEQLPPELIISDRVSVIRK